MKCKFSYSLDVEEPDLADVPRVLSQLSGFLRMHGVADDHFISQFELAAAEAINNATEHGCSSTMEKFFRVRLHLNQEHVELRVVDPSAFKGWEKEPMLPDDPMDDRGRGHFIMFRMTDELLHEEEDGFHVLVLRKRFFNSSWQHLPWDGDHIVTQMTDELVSSYELIDTLVSLGKWLAMASDINAFMELALEKLCTVTGAETAYVRIEEEGKLTMLHQRGNALHPPAASLDATGEGVEVEVFRSGKEITLPIDAHLPENDPLSGMMLAGFVAPITYMDQNHGVLVLLTTKPAPFFDAGKLKVARIISEYLGIIMALREVQKLREAEKVALHDLETAARIQLSLMPQDFPPISGLDLYGTSQPCLHAGGDYFDILTLPDQSVLCIIADVMGKGLPAALLAIMLRTNLHALVASNKSDPGKIIEKINSLMSKDLIRLEVFITLVCTWISSDRNLIRSASAGHLSPILLKADGTVVEIEGTGVPVGVFPDSIYSSQSTAFEPGDRLLLYTDGIIEATDHGDSSFEIQGVKECLSRSGSLSSRATAVRLLDEVADFSEGKAPSDDRTLILVSRTQ
jgi:serine phosphatase RsbU (regulator of sigma subunit)/anti-sigma regulatory factor (Ser/Thr protein kinase)